jgi:hypothetical protein
VAGPLSIIGDTTVRCGKGAMQSPTLPLATLALASWTLVPDIAATADVAERSEA